MALITVAIADAAPCGFTDYGLLVRVEKIRQTDNELVAAIKAFAADDVVHVIPNLGGRKSKRRNHNSQ